MVAGFSEAGGYFRSDNFLSNESGYQTVIPGLRKRLEPGGVYLGVGPEQNFTYILAFAPDMAFIIDIRRQNMLEHLFYKALMETSADRVEFVSRLFARPRAMQLTATATADILFRTYESEKTSAALFETNVARVLDYLEKQKGFKLSDQDEAGIRYVAQAFFKTGPDLRYTFVGGDAAFMRMPRYSDLVTESDGISRNWNFLATEDQFRAVQRLQQSNLIVPLVGDFGGSKAIRSVARYIEQHHGTVRVFYTSNVEQYLFQDKQQWKRFYDNCAVLPIDSTSTFIRYVLDAGGFDRQRTTLTSSIDGIVKANRVGFIQSYYDVVSLSQ
jgi:hypothetical protein